MMDEQTQVKAVLVVVALVIGLGLGYQFGLTRVSDSNTLPSMDSGLTVLYLYPSRCVDCSQKGPGACDYCNSYYDETLLEAVSQELVVPINWYFTSFVSEATLVVAGGDADEFGVGAVEGKYGIANTLCAVAEHEKSCLMRDKELERVESCIEKYNLTPETLIYHYTSGECSHCEYTSAEVTQYQRESGKPVYWIDHQDPEQKKILDECFGAFTNLNLVPQLLCPRNGLDLTGRSSVNQIYSFANRCEGT
ncbi:MAG: hypothetical protein GF334_07625 [Candidatus Altiarchaeales archaeon]|nr:hypothetical protein [Candidatus Altiarchaeales archaeon]